MALRNQPLPFQSVALLSGVYFAAAVISILVLVVLLALLLRSRPTIAIDSPAALTGMSLALSSLFAAGIVLWWSGFGSAPTGVEVAVGGALVILFIAISASVFSAALLSFSIHETKRIPLVAQRDRTVPIAIVAVVAAAAIGLWVVRTGSTAKAEQPAQIVVAPTDARVALLAVDGMTWDLFAAQRPADLELAFATPVTPLADTHSSAERWASLGTGTPPQDHLVRAIDGIQLVGGSQVLQAVSRWDYTIDGMAAPLGLARRIPLPPTVRRRHYVWEIMGSRGVSSVAVNWWVSEDLLTPGLLTVSQAAIFGEAKRETSDPVDLALAIDRIAREKLELLTGPGEYRFATAYLPASDIVLNRLDLDQSARVAASIRAATGVFETARALEDAGYQIVIVGMPGEGSDANAVIASTMPASQPPTLDSIAPTLLTIMGFPTSGEMSGDIFVNGEPTSRISTYGDREAAGQRATASDEYYESLKSLGYIR